MLLLQKKAQPAIKQVGPHKHFINNHTDDANHVLATINVSREWRQHWEPSRVVMLSGLPLSIRVLLETDFQASERPMACAPWAGRTVRRLILPAANGL